MCFQTLRWTHFAKGLVGKTRAQLREQTRFSFRGSSRNICAGTSGNDRKFAFPWAWRAASTSEGRAEPSRAGPGRVTFAPPKSLWGPAASGSHYRCHHPNRLLCRLHSCGTGPDSCLPTQYLYIFTLIIFISSCGHNRSARLFRQMPLCCGLNEGSLPYAHTQISLCCAAHNWTREHNSERRICPLPV